MSASCRICAVDRLVGTSICLFLKSILFIFGGAGVRRLPYLRIGSSHSVLDLAGKSAFNPCVFFNYAMTTWSRYPKEVCGIYTCLYLDDCQVWVMWSKIVGVPGSLLNPGPTLYEFFIPLFSSRNNSYGHFILPYLLYTYYVNVIWIYLQFVVR
jgi:hypothetical protein